MAIQELHVQILHRSGKHNVNADTLSRAPVAQSEVVQKVSCETVASVEAEDELAGLQRDKKELNY